MSRKKMGTAKKEDQNFKARRSEVSSDKYRTVKK